MFKSKKSKRKEEEQSIEFPKKREFYWHFIRNDGTLGYRDKRKPKLGQWMLFEPDKSCKTWDGDSKSYIQNLEPILCQQGMHASEELRHALRWAPGLRLTRVELGEIYDGDTEKMVSNRRRILEVWTPLQIRKAIIAVARDIAAELLQKEMDWWLKNCPFEEVRKAIRKKDVKRFMEYKKWLNPSEIGIFGPPPRGYMGSRYFDSPFLHPLYKRDSFGDERFFLEQLSDAEKYMEKETEMPKDRRGQSESDLLSSAFRRGLTEKEFLKKLGAGRKAKNVKRRKYNGN